MDVGRFLSDVKMRPQRKTDDIINVLIMRISVAQMLDLAAFSIGFVQVFYIYTSRPNRPDKFRAV